MKKIDKLLIKSFFAPFVVTFLIAIFVLLMQFLWLYIDDLAGKGLGILTIFELLGYKSAGLIPMAIPLATLISSVLVMGNMGEKYELASLMSGGVSLLRIMRPMIIIGLFLSLASFLSSNYLIPSANLKFGSRMFDIQQQKASLSINEGEFNDDFYGFSIRVGKKDPDGRHIEDVLIYNHAESSKGLINIITAKRGEMYLTPNRKYFVFDLYDGNQYVEAKLKKTGKNKKARSFPFTRTAFSRWTKMFDLSEFLLKESDADIFKQNRNMLNVSQLDSAVDSIRFSIKKREISLNNQIANYLNFVKKDKSLLPDKSKFMKERNPIDKKGSTILKNAKNKIKKDSTKSKGATDLDTLDVKSKVKKVKKSRYKKSTEEQDVIATEELRSSKSPTINKTAKKSILKERNKALRESEDKKRKAKANAKNKKSKTVNKKNKKNKKKAFAPYEQNLTDFFNDTSFIQSFSDEIDKGNILSKTKSSIRSIHTSARNTSTSLLRIMENKVKHIFNIHSKFSMALICFIFIFVGAPMGALVRKGGFGYPVLFAIIVFVGYIMMANFFKKYSETFSMSPELAAWMPVIIIAPIGFLLTYMAMKGLKVPKFIMIFFQLISNGVDGIFSFFNKK